MNYLLLIVAYCNLNYVNYSRPSPAMSIFLLFLTNNNLLSRAQNIWNAKRITKYRVIPYWVLNIYVVVLNIYVVVLNIYVVVLNIYVVVLNIYVVVLNPYCLISYRVVT